MNSKKDVKRSSNKPFAHDHAIGQTGRAGRDFGIKAVWFDKNLMPRQVFSDNRQGPASGQGTRQMVFAGDIAVGIEWDRRHPNGCYIINKAAVLSEPDNMGRRNITNDFEALQVTDTAANKMLDDLFAKHAWLQDWLLPCEMNVIRLPEDHFPPDEFFLNAKKREKASAFLEKFGLVGIIEVEALAKEPKEHLFLEPRALNFNPRDYRSVCVSQGSMKQNEVWYGCDGEGGAAVPLDFMPSLDKGGDVNQPGTTGIAGYDKYPFLIMVRTGHRMNRDRTAYLGTMVKVFDTKAPEVRQPGRKVQSEEQSVETHEHAAA